MLNFPHLALDPSSDDHRPPVFRADAKSRPDALSAGRIPVRSPTRTATRKPKPRTLQSTLISRDTLAPHTLGRAK